MSVKGNCCFTPVVHAFICDAMDGYRFAAGFHIGRLKRHICLGHISGNLADVKSKIGNFTAVIVIVAKSHSVFCPKVSIRTLGTNVICNIGICPVPVSSCARNLCLGNEPEHAQ